MLCPGGRPCNLPIVAPDFTAVDHAGRPVKLSDFRGKVVLLNFWASWCAVCKTEKPALTRVAEQLGGDDFVVITLASDRSWTDVLLGITQALAPEAPQAQRGPNGEVTMAAALAAYQHALPDGTPFKVFLDPPKGEDNIGEITAKWGIKAVPESALIDRQGNIRAYFVNKRDWAAPVAQTCLRSVIDE
jgi:thiol-disulfide isomerase/thioredoxin